MLNKRISFFSFRIFMMPDIATTVLLLFFGFGSGLFVGTAAGTAASFLIPGLTIVIGYSTHEAIGTSLAVDCIIGIVAGYTFIKNKYVNLKSAFLLVIAGIIGALIGSTFTAQAPEGSLNIAIGCFLLFIGYNFVRKGIKKNVDGVEKKINFSFFRNHHLFSLLLLGGIIGGLSGFIGIGGSRMLSLILIFIMGYSLHQAVGTSLVMMIFIAGSGAINHGFQGEIVLPALLILGISAAGGAYLGSHMANKINEERLARIVGIIIFILGSIIILKNFF